MKNDHLPVLARYIQLFEENWKDDAACIGLDQDLFFGTANDKLGKEKREEVIRLCNSCPVKDKCYDYARKNHEIFGIWGGVDFTRSRRQRQAYIARQKEKLSESQKEIS
jgi:WhiB family redox-sensing transcriptional regulator